jgi:hypothetical protein
MVKNTVPLIDLFDLAGEKIEVGSVVHHITPYKSQSVKMSFAVVVGRTPSLIKIHMLTLKEDLEGRKYLEKIIRSDNSVYEKKAQAEKVAIITNAGERWELRFDTTAYPSF